MIEHPLSKASVDAVAATLRHPGPMGKLATSLGAAPQDIWYEAKFNFGSKTASIDFNGVIDYREALSAHHAPLIESLKLCGRLGGVTKKATIPLASLVPGSYPLELWGDDPTLLHQNPSLWLFNQNNDERYPAWTEWKLRGLFRKISGPMGPRKNPSPWLAQLERQGQVAMLVEGNTQIYTLVELSQNTHSANKVVQKEAEKIFQSVPYLFGQHYWG